MTQQLSTIRPDLQDLVTQLQNKLSSKDSWKGLLPTEAGQTIIEFIASIGALDQYSLEMIFKEGFPQTSRIDSSAFGITRLLGVRLKRKAPANIEVTITNNTANPLIFAKFSEFDVSGVKLFNRSQITVNAGDTDAHVLYQGELRTAGFTSTGNDFQSFISPESEFTVSDEDVEVLINGNPIPRSTLGMWKFKKTTAVPVNDVFQDLTTKEGSLQILFGNDLFGTKPLTNDVLSIRYMITEGLLGNDGSLVGESVTYTGQPDDVVITSTTGLKNGSNEINASLYKRISPRIFASYEVAAQEQDYDIIFNNPIFPVVDYRIQGQRDIDTTDVRYMNLSKVWLLLPDDILGNPVVPTPTEFNNFTNWLQKNAVWTMRYFYDIVFEPEFGLARPAPIGYYLEVEIYCKNTADLGAVTAEVKTALQNFVALGVRSISRDIYISDIIDLVKRTSPQIDYVILKNPTTDIITNALTMQPSFEILNTGGSLGNLLAPETYSYIVTARFDYTGTPLVDLETKPTVSLSPAVSSGINTASIRVEWKPLYGAKDYRVYGRMQGGGFGLLATVTDNFYLDTGAAVPNVGIQPPVQDASGYRVPTLEEKPLPALANDGIIINAFFSGR